MQKKLFGPEQEEFKINSAEALEEVQKESQRQELPKQKAIFSVPEKIRRRVHNLPDPTRPPLGYDEHKAFDRVFPYIRLPILHPQDIKSGDTVIFNDPKATPNRLVLGDNLEFLRTLPSQSIDLIYIDPPFFSGRQYNVIWGDTNEVRTFYDIWEGGIDTYLVWLNARLWEMRRVLKKTGSIYVHCDWHASHYIKCEMDKIFGYENFQNEIIWQRTLGHHLSSKMDVMTDAILWYSKTRNFTFNSQYQKLTKTELEKKFPFVEKETGRRFTHEKLEQSSNVYSKGEVRIVQGRKIISNIGWRWAQDTFDRRLSENPHLIFWTKEGRPRYKRYADEYEGRKIGNFWTDIEPLSSNSSEYVGYPTQKPKTLLGRVIEASSNEGDVVADFFCGGGTTPAVAMKLKRRFIVCDISRVAVAVTLDRLVKVGEEMSGVKSNVSADENFEQKLQAEGAIEKVPDIDISYMGVYPVDKFKFLNQEQFVDFVLICYGASKNTAAGVTTGFRPPGRQEPILVGPANPDQAVSAKEVKEFFEEIKSQVEPNKEVRAKIIGWKFSRQVIKYQKVLQDYCEDNNLPIKPELVPLDSRDFRARILQRYPDAGDAEFYLRFSKPPVIGDIHTKKVGPLTYEFEAVDTFSTNEDGYLVNCQWDFDYNNGHFSADKDYILSREKVKEKGKGEHFQAILTAKHKFEREGEYTIACKVQDNLAGETIFSKKIEI